MLYLIASFLVGLVLGLSLSLLGLFSIGSDGDPSSLLALARMGAQLAANVVLAVFVNWCWLFAADGEELFQQRLAVAH